VVNICMNNFFEEGHSRLNDFKAQMSGKVLSAN
jgi:hypothetical protein